MEKYFLHRIQEENGTFTKGIEVHDTLDSAIVAFHGRMKLAYSNPQAQDMTFVSCKITDSDGNIVRPYDETWMKENVENAENTFFMHHIRLDGETFTKDIDAFENYDSAKQALHAQMEYGYNNTRFPNVSFVSCMITDRWRLIANPETWNKNN